MREFTSSAILFSTFLLFLSFFGIIYFFVIETVLCLWEWSVSNKEIKRKKMDLLTMILIEDKLNIPLDVVIL